MCAPMFTAALCTSQIMEATQVPINRQLDKDVVHIYNGMLLSYKKNEILLFGTTWMDLDLEDNIYFLVGRNF